VLVVDVFPLPSDVVVVDDPSALSVFVVVVPVVLSVVVVMVLPSEYSVTQVSTLFCVVQVGPLVICTVGFTVVVVVHTPTFEPCDTLQKLTPVHVVTPHLHVAMCSEPSVGAHAGVADGPLTKLPLASNVLHVVTDAAEVAQVTEEPSAFVVVEVEDPSGF
jgi:hypothetical protein